MEAVNSVVTDTPEEVARPPQMQFRPVLQVPEPTVLSNSASFMEIPPYYLDRTVRRSTCGLETIYEEPGEGKPLMSKRKFVRKLLFDDSCKPMMLSAKLQRRHLKAMRLKGMSKRRKLSEDSLMETSLEEGNFDKENEKKVANELPMFKNAANSAQNGENDEIEMEE